MKRIACLIIATVLIVSLCACGKKSKAGTTDSGDFIFKEKESVALGEPDVKVDAKSIFKNIKYNEKMFYGDHKLIGGDSAKENLLSDAGYYPDFKNEYDKKISLLPIEIECGSNTLEHMCTHIKQYEWAQVNFQTEDNSLWYKLCAYKVSGNKISFYPLEDFKYDEKNSAISYKLSDFCFEYEFEFNGLTLNISKSGKTVSLTTGVDSEDNPYIHADCYVTGESPKIDEGIDHVTLHWDEEESYVYLSSLDNKISIYNSSAKLSKDGTLTLTIPFSSGNKTYQFACFYCEEDGLILANADKIYYYTSSYSDVYNDTLGDSISIEDAEKIANVDQEKLEKIVEKKKNLSADLSEAFKNAGINAVVDEANGEITLDSSVLFGGDSSVITAEGKALLNKFTSVYSSVVFDEKYKGFISEIRVEGHTAPVANSTYEDGLPLSEERAENVKNYCCSQETGIDAKYTDALSKTLKAVGMSNSKPVIDENGNVNMALSRRVTFRFIINING